jgi:hypothetical protein
MWEITLRDRAVLRRRSTSSRRRGSVPHAQLRYATEAAPHNFGRDLPWRERLWPKPGTSVVVSALHSEVRATSCHASPKPSKKNEALRTRFPRCLEKTISVVAGRAAGRPRYRHSGRNAVRILRPLGSVILGATIAFVVMCSESVPRPPARTLAGTRKTRYRKVNLGRVPEKRIAAR